MRFIIVSITTFYKSECLDWRRIADKYSDLSVYAYRFALLTLLLVNISMNVYGFSDHTPFVDQTMAIDSTVFGSVLAALVCTAIICLIFIPHLPSVAMAVLSVLSISFGIFGLLSLWGVDLDPLSMAALLMAIGFSVDYISHLRFVI